MKRLSLQLLIMSAMHTGLLKSSAQTINLFSLQVGALHTITHPTCGTLTITKEKTMSNGDEEIKIDTTHAYNWYKADSGRISHITKKDSKPALRTIKYNQTKHDSYILCMAASDDEAKDLVIKTIDAQYNK